MSAVLYDLSLEELWELRGKTITFFWKVDLRLFKVKS